MLVRCSIIARLLITAGGQAVEEELTPDPDASAVLYNNSRCRTGRLPSALKLPEVPCSRTDLSRHDVCSLLARPPPYVPQSSVTAHSRVFADRSSALDALVPRNGSLIEVGIFTGVFTRWMLRALRPTSVLAMDVSTYAMKECGTKTRKAATDMGAELTCARGDSRKLLAALTNDTYDLIYVDGDHEYKGVCGDLEAARPKVKVGGLMVLNDYYLFETAFFAQRGRWGVYGIIHAAHEFLARYDSAWEVAYLTMSPLAGGNQADLGLRRVR